MQYDLNNPSTYAWAFAWLRRHTDARHPGTRADCAHCQEMIADFGPMPPPELIFACERAQPRKPRTKVIIPPDLRRAVFARDQHTCRACGATSDLTADHIVPESRGGPTTMENLQTLCRTCNCRKGTR